jgi:HEPN domain-containing protein
MTNDSLARSYLEKAKVRLAVLDLLFEKEAYSDVVREAQELVELALKALLRHIGIEPPKWHDVGAIILEHRERFAGVSQTDLDRLASASTWLRKERELSLYGDVDFIPTERYTPDDGTRAIEDARFVLTVAERVVGAERTTP